MAFRAFQKIAEEFPTRFYTIVDSPTPNGVVLEKCVSNEEIQEKMPDPSMYDLDKSLQAGVNMDSVNTKIVVK